MFSLRSIQSLAFALLGLICVSPNVSRAHHLEISHFELRTIHEGVLSGRLRLAPTLLDKQSRKVSPANASERLLAKIRGGLILQFHERECQPELELVELWQENSPSPGDLIDLVCRSLDTPSPGNNSKTAPKQHGVSLRWLVADHELRLTYPALSQAGRVENASALLQHSQAQEFLVADRTATMKIARPEKPESFSRRDFQDMVELGFEHVLPAGWDHVVFMALLAAGSYSERKRLFQLLSAFTIAHAVALFLAVTGLVRVSPLIVEPVILLSLVLVAFELSWRFFKRNKNPKRATSQLGLMTITGFGLFHGLGFGGAFIELGLPEAKLLPSLLAFHVGIELGQLLVVGATCILCLASSHFLARRNAHVATSP